MKTIKDLKKEIEDILEELNSCVAGLSLLWKNKIEPDIDYEEYVCPREKKYIKKATDKILKSISQAVEIERKIERKRCLDCVGENLRFDDEENKPPTYLERKELGWLRYEERYNVRGKEIRNKIKGEDSIELSLAKALTEIFKTVKRVKGEIPKVVLNKSQLKNKELVNQFKSGGFEIVEKNKIKDEEK